MTTERKTRQVTPQEWADLQRMRAKEVERRVDLSVAKMYEHLTETLKTQPEASVSCNSAKNRRLLYEKLTANGYAFTTQVVGCVPSGHTVYSKFRAGHIHLYSMAKWIYAGRIFLEDVQPGTVSKQLLSGTTLEKWTAAFNSICDSWVHANQSKYIAAIESGSILAPPLARIILDYLIIDESQIVKLLKAQWPDTDATEHTPLCNAILRTTIVQISARHGGRQASPQTPLRD